MKLKMSAGVLLASITLASAATAPQVLAQVPPELKTRITDIGRVVNPAATAAIYAPLHVGIPDGITAKRDIAYGPSPRNVLDVFSPPPTTRFTRPVLIFVPGGRGDKIEQVPGGAAFYDNVMLFATANGMIGVNMQRDNAPGQAWDTGARNISAVIQWVQANIGQYGGDPARVYIWGHSAGAANLANYLAHPELYGSKGIGVKAAILQSGGGINLAPLQSTVENPPGPAPAAAAGPAPAQPDAATLLARSNLNGLKALSIPLFVTAAQYDPPRTVDVTEMLNRELLAAGKVPKFLIVEDHGHMSEIFAVNTADNSVTNPVLAFIRSAR
jgi:triacylglycerol lipase